MIRGCPSQFGAGGESAPHRLSCGDVVCSGCWSAARAVGNCPACGFVEVKLEFVDEALAFVGKTRLEAESGPASPTPACADCNALGDSDVPATHLCGCGDGKPLCVDHVLVHSRKRHELIPVDPVAAVGQFCVKHPEERVTMFCMDDGEAMCTICATVSHRGVGRKAGKSKQPPPPHCGHNVVELKEARSLLMPELSSALKSLGSDCGRVSDLAAAVTEARDALRASSASSEAKTHTAFEALHAIIDAHKVRVLGSLRKATSAREQSLSTQLMRLEACLSQMCDGLTLGSFALEHCNPSLMSSTLTSLAVVSRLLQRESLGPCDDGFVALDVNLAGVVDAFQYASALRQVIDYVIRA